MKLTGSDRLSRGITRNTEQAFRCPVFRKVACSTSSQYTSPTGNLVYFSALPSLLYRYSVQSAFVYISHPLIAQTGISQPLHDDFPLFPAGSCSQLLGGAETDRVGSNPLGSLPARIFLLFLPPAFRLPASSQQHICTSSEASDASFRRLNVYWSIS